MREQTIAIITARGGSKRIPRKNIKPFCGKPIIEYSIQAAMAAGIFDTIMVSTDDEEIAQVARKAGAEVPFFRKKETSGDFATTSDAYVTYRRMGFGNTGHSVLVPAFAGNGAYKREDCL